MRSLSAHGSADWCWSSPDQLMPNQGGSSYDVKSTAVLAFVVSR